MMYIQRLRSLIIKLRKKIWAAFRRGKPCYEIYPHDGLAPHRHVMSFAGELPIKIIEPKEKWPDNYEHCDGWDGRWYCPDKKCKAICEGRKPEEEQ
jgi:hypothetical protein